MAHLLTRAEILDAIGRVHDFDTYPPADPRPQDGTYRIIPTWVGNARVWMAQRIDGVGYEVGYQAIDNDEHWWYALDEARFGYWRNPETGEECLDRTVEIRGALPVAERIAVTYGQTHIWNWQTRSAWAVDAELYA